MKSRKDSWGELFRSDEDGGGFESSLNDLELNEADGDGVIFLEEAHEALARLEQKTNKRGRLMKQPRRAESWQ